VLTGLVLIGSVCFNAALAIVSGHVMVASSALVIAAEATFVSAAIYLALQSWRAEMTPVIAIIVMLVLFAIVRSVATGAIEPKYLRDTLIIPTFLLLGMASGTNNLVRTVIIVHAIVFAVFLLEALAPSIYSELFRIQDYYINTRGNSASEFYNSNSDLFISATRPNERFLPFIDEERLSSIFLEPVSLGNYCTIIVAFVVASFRRLSKRTLAFFVISTIAMLFGCDGRFAVVCSILILLASFVASRLPPHSAIVYLPAAVLVMFMIVSSAAIQTGGDDFVGRIAHTKDMLMRFDVQDFLGISNAFIDEAVDSGVAYLIVTQSLPGLILLWMFIAWGPVEHTTEQIRYTHALCLYLALSMLVSYSFLTIKTGALLWFIQGTLQTGKVGNFYQHRTYPEDNIRSLPKEV
jgi:putative polymerase